MTSLLNLHRLASFTANKPNIVAVSFRYEGRVDETTLTFLCMPCVAMGMEGVVLVFYTCTLYIIFIFLCSFAIHMLLVHIISH